MQVEFPDILKQNRGSWGFSDEEPWKPVANEDASDEVKKAISDFVADVTGEEEPVKKSSESEENTFSIFKTDEDKRLVFGWASVSITVDGVQLEDRQNDMIDPEDLEEAAYEYVLNFRDTGEEHIPSMRKKGKLVESCVFTAEKQRAMGIPEGTIPIGWWVGFKIEDDDAWARVKNGTYRMFSIEGRASREPVEKSEERVAKTFSEILKFNPYHDERGRFSSADGYTSFTFRTKNPEHQKWADMAIAREKERYASASAASANPTNDPETIAGIKRGPAMTHEQADEGRGNPHYGDLDAEMKKLQDLDKRYMEAVSKGAPEKEKAMLRKEMDEQTELYNKAYEESGKYRNNCQSCVVAYEARLRGYDVEAMPKEKSNYVQGELAKKQANAWKDPKTGAPPKETTNDPGIRTKKQMMTWLEENVEPGARYTFSHGWKGTDGRIGHIVSVSRDKNNALRIFDPQSGKTYSGDGVSEYIGRVRGTWNNGFKTLGRLGLLRVDNMQINEKVANAVLKGAK